MIIDKEVWTKWNYKNRKLYESKGYIYTKSRDRFIIKIEDLPLTSHVKVNCKCDICGNINYMDYRYYIEYINNGGFYACKKCNLIKNKQTNLERYGVDNVFKSEKIKNKQKQTCLEKYGVDNVFKSEEIKEKIKETNLKKYGVEYTTQVEQIKNKQKQTCLEKYGVDNVFKSEEIKEKIKETMLFNYGVEYPLQNKQLSRKQVNTTIERYGDVFFSHVPAYNIRSIYYLDLISNETGLYIQHAENGGEKKFHSYHIDGYNEKYNLCIEIDEKHHNTMKNKKEDIERQEHIKKYFNCKFIRINWENIDNEIYNIIEYIKKEIICSETNKTN